MGTKCTCFEPHRLQIAYMHISALSYSSSFRTTKEAAINAMHHDDIIPNPEVSTSSSNIDDNEDTSPLDCSFDDADDDDDDVPMLQNLLDDDATTTDVETNQPTAVAAAATIVPVTILTGFLGSGKSTLIKYILNSSTHGRKIAVIENEYGGGGNSNGGNYESEAAINVESVIVRDGTTISMTDDNDFVTEETESSSSTKMNRLVDLVELPNGCVCCTVKDELVTTLERLLDVRSDLEYIIIELSGMANPGPVASIFWLDGPLNSRLRLDGIICCVDARNIGYQLEWTSSSPAAVGAHDDDDDDDDDDDGDDGGGDEAARQIAFADRIIVNKVDLLSHKTQNEKQNRLRPTSNDYTSDNNKCNDNNNNSDQSETTTSIESVLRQIESINPTASILTTTYSIVNDLNWILDTNCFNVEHAKSVNMSIQQVHQQQRQQLLYANPGDGWTKNNIHRHTNAVGTTSLFSIGSVSLHQINYWLASILWPDQDEYDSVLRARLEGRDTSCDEEIDDDKEDGECRSTKMMMTKKKSKDKQRIYRVKGVLSVIHDDHLDDDDEGLVNSNDGTDRRRYIVQAVHDLWDIQPASMDLCWNDDDNASAAETRCCKVIIIGKCLDVDRLRMGFMECFMTATTNAS